MSLCSATAPSQRNPVIRISLNAAYGAQQAGSPGKGGPPSGPRSGCQPDRESKRRTHPISPRTTTTPGRCGTPVPTHPAPAGGPALPCHGLAVPQQGSACMQGHSHCLAECGKAAARSSQPKGGPPANHVQRELVQSPTGCAWSSGRFCAARHERCSGVRVSERSRDEPEYWEARCPMRPERHATGRPETGWLGLCGPGSCSEQEYRLA